MKLLTSSLEGNGYPYDQYHLYLKYKTNWLERLFLRKSNKVTYHYVSKTGIIWFDRDGWKECGYLHNLNLERYFRTHQISKKKEIHYE